MSDQGTTSNVFDAGGEDLFSDFFPDEEEAPQPDAKAPETPEQAQPEPESPQPAVNESANEAIDKTEQPQAEAPSDEEPEPTEPKEEAPQEQPLLGGKFKTPDDAVAAFQNAERLAHTRAQEAAQLRREREQIIAALRNAEPVLRKAMELQNQQPSTQQLIESGELDTSDPQVIQQLIQEAAAHEADRLVQARMAPLQEQQEQQRVQQGLTEIQAFRQEHPDAAPHEPAVAQLVQEYRYDEETGEEIFPPTKDNLTTALTLATNPQAHGLLQALNLHPEKEWVEHAIEAVQNPALQQAILANPHWLESAAGMEYARRQAGLPQVVQQAQTNATQAQTQADEAARKAAFVEKGEGSDQDLAPGRKPQDPLEEALLDAHNERGSVFF